MASTRQLKSRIRSVKSTKQITKAMELVASSKFRHAQMATQASEPYSEAARELLTHLSTLTDVRRNVYFAPRPIKNRLVIVLTSDRGQAGAYNANVIKRFIRILQADRDNGISTKVMPVGKKGAHFASKLSGIEVVGVYHGLPERASAADIRPILAGAVDSFVSGEVDAVDVVTTRFENSFVQKVESFQLLPAGFETEEVSTDIAQATFEPTIEEVLEGATKRLLEAQLYQALLDATASEHAMRRVAMKNATDNASELVEDLTLEMNKVRQAAITQEISEISGGVEAMK